MRRGVNFRQQQVDVLLHAALQPQVSIINHSTPPSGVSTLKHSDRARRVMYTCTGPQADAAPRAHAVFTCCDRFGCKSTNPHLHGGALQAVRADCHDGKIAVVALVLAPRRVEVDRRRISVREWRWPGANSCGLCDWCCSAKWRIRRGCTCCSRRALAARLQMSKAVRWCCMKRATRLWLPGRMQTESSQRN